MQEKQILLTGMSFFSFLMGTLGGMVDCRSAGPSLSPLCGEFSPLPTTPETTQCVSEPLRDGRKGQIYTKCGDAGIYFAAGDTESTVHSHLI